MTAEERPQQLLKAEFRMAETACASPGEAANYLAGTSTLGLFYRRKAGSCKVTAYSDAALGHDLSQGRGRSGVIVKIGRRPVCWKTSIQQTVADSSQAAELLAIHEATQMTLSINNLLEELGCKSREPPSNPRGQRWNEGNGHGEHRRKETLQTPRPQVPPGS